MQNSVLEFVRVISAQQQVVSGVNYYITLEAKDGEIKNEYKAKVWERESQELLEFMPTLGAGGEIDHLARFAVEEQNKREVLSIFFLSSFKSTSLPKNQDYLFILF